MYSWGCIYCYGQSVTWGSLSYALGSAQDDQELNPYKAITTHPLMTAATARNFVHFSLAWW